MQYIDVRKILLEHGPIVEDPRLFFHRELWRRIEEMDFLVTSIEKQKTHNAWEIRCKGGVAAEAFLLINSGRKSLKRKGLIEELFSFQIRKCLKALGKAIRKDEIVVVRSKCYFHITLIWKKGHPGRLAHNPRKSDVLSVQLKPWLLSVRN